MRTTPKRGFTLIELLIVIAIIGILAAVLLPNLMSARMQATERAAQMYSSAVFKAFVAVLAADIELDGNDVLGGTYACGPNAAETEEIIVNGTTYNYGWPEAPNGVTGCALAVNAATATIDVEITTANNTYTNGELQ